MIFPHDFTRADILAVDNFLIIVDQQTAPWVNEETVVVEWAVD